MLELRRRVRLDPASIAFAQLAEECRRVGSNEEAVEVCRAGLARNPGYLSARVTLGRALTELGLLDAAKAELDIVVAGVPDNLAAIRGLAEILQRRGEMKEALQYYKRALELAKHDPDLEDTVERISRAVAPEPVHEPADAHVSIEEIFNFDKLIDQLGLPPEPPPAAAAPVPSLEELFAEPPPAVVEEAAPADDFFVEIAPEPAEEPVILSSAGTELATEQPVEDALAESPIEAELEPETVIEVAAETMEVEPVIEASAGLESVELSFDDADELAVMERELREREEQRAHDEQRARAELGQRRRAAMIGALETWLSAILADRAGRGA